MTVPTLTQSSRPRDAFTINQSTFSDLTGSIDGSEPAESSYDPDYTALKMVSDRGNKRQKRSDGSIEVGGLFEFDRSHELEDDLHDDEGTYERAVKADFANFKRTTSIDTFEQRNNDFSYDDCFLERQPNQRGSSLFFGLALVFGAVGAVTSFNAGTTDTSIGDRIEFSSSSSMAGAKLLSTAESRSIKDGDEMEHLTSFEVDPSSPSSNISTAFLLLLQAVRALPVFTYVSFLLSLVFLVLYLKPFSSFLNASSSTISLKDVRPARKQTSSGSQSGRSRSFKQATPASKSSQSQKAAHQRRQK